MSVVLLAIDARGIATVTLNRPERGTAYNAEVLAALIDGLDLVITVDTSVAHLAGALGKPVWILLARSPDWRWLMNRDDSPWYPTVRLFRQTVARQWNDVMQSVAEAVSNWTGKNGN